EDLPGDPSGPFDYAGGSGDGGALQAGDQLHITGRVGGLTDAEDYVSVAFAAGGHAPFALVGVLDGDVRISVVGGVALLPGELYLVERGETALIGIELGDGVPSDTEEEYTILVGAGGDLDVDADGEPDACDSCPLAPNLGDR